MAKTPKTKTKTEAKKAVATEKESNDPATEVRAEADTSTARVQSENPPKETSAPKDVKAGSQPGVNDPRDAVKQLRVNIDALLQLSEELTENKRDEVMGTWASKKGRDISGSTKHGIHNIRRAKRWLGKVLACLGADYPYNPNGYKNASQVHAETDQADISNVRMPGSEYIEHVNAIREHLEYAINDLLEIRTTAIAFADQQVSDPHNGYKLAVAITSAYSALCEAKMDMGEEYGRLRSEHEAAGHKVRKEPKAPKVELPVQTTDGELPLPEADKAKTPAIEE